MNEMLGGSLGFILGAAMCILISMHMRVNISDEELYRFCIVRQIKLEDCKIPPFPLERREAQNDRHN